MSKLAELKRMETEFNTIAEKLEAELNCTEVGLTEELDRTVSEQTSRVFQLLMDYVNEYDLRDSDYYKNMVYIGTVRFYNNESKTGWYDRDIYIGHRYNYNKTKHYFEIESRNRAKMQSRWQVGTIGNKLNFNDVRYYNLLHDRLLNFENEFLETFEESIVDIMQKRVEKKRVTLENKQAKIDELKNKIEKY